MTFRELSSHCSPAAGRYDTASQLSRHIYRRFEAALAAGEAARDAIRTPEQLAARQQWLREAFPACLGGLPSSDTPLNPRVTGAVQGDGYRVEKVIVESRPGVYVTTNLYVPDGITSPRGAVLFVCGHHQWAKHQEEYQIVCQHLVQAGLVVLAQDPVGQGERFSYYERALGHGTIQWGVQEHDYAGSQCLPLGDAIARYFVHDSMRALDYLCTRPEVDAARIGVTGNSGGGTQTSLLMLCEPRFAAAAPATFIMDMRSWLYEGGAQDAEQVWPGFPAVGCDHEDILLAMAPKPVLVLAVTHDFFPLEGTRRTVARAKRLWELCGQGDRLRMFEDQVEHCYSPRLATAAAEFFSEHLLGQKVTPDASRIKDRPMRELWCTESGQVREEMEGARFVFEECAERLRELEDTRPKDPGAVRAWVRERVLAHRRPADLNPRPYSRAQVEEMTAQAWMWWTQEDLLGNGVLLRSVAFHDQDLPVTITLWPGGTAQVAAHADWIRETCASGRAVLVLDTAGEGGLVPNPLRKWDDAVYGVLRTLSDNLTWLGDSMAALRGYDVLRAVEAVALLPGLRGDDVRLYARGRTSVYAQLAVAAGAKVSGLEIVEGMGSYASWVNSRYYNPQDIRTLIVPGLLRHGDLPDL